MLAKTLFVLMLYHPIGISEAIPDNTGQRWGSRTRIEAIKEFDTAEACDQGLKLYAQNHADNTAPGTTMRVRLKCEALQEFTHAVQKTPPVNPYLKTR